MAEPTADDQGEAAGDRVTTAHVAAAGDTIAAGLGGDGSAGDGHVPDVHVVVIFDNFGPYHIARLSAAAERMRITGIELAGNSEDYIWDSPAHKTAFERMTLFSSGTSGQRTTREIVAAIEAALDRAAPDAVAIPGWADRGGLAALRWARRHDVPVIVLSESNELDHDRRWFREVVKRWIVGQCSAGLAGGTLASDYLAKLGLARDRISVGYDVIDNRYFADGAADARADARALRARHGLPERYFLTCCRFIPKKNLQFLVAAFAEYRRSHGADAWHLVLVGDGEMRVPLQRQIAELGIEEAVYMPGFKQYPDLPAMYGLASAFVLPSTVEQWGLVVNEAMASGLPVIVSDRCGSAADLVEHGVNGFHFPPRDRLALVQALDVVAHGGVAAAMGQASSDVISRWSPARFAAGLDAAVRRGIGAPLPKLGVAASLALKMMIR